MQAKVDVSIAFYGKPYQTIVTIKTLMKFSAQHIDKIYLSREQKQPHGDYIGIFKVIDYFKNDKDVRIIVNYPHYFLGLGVDDLDKAKKDTRWRQSIMYQYALEHTDKKYLAIMHNDMLFFGDMIGAMLEEFRKGKSNLAGVSSIGQCWSCPAGPDWGNECNSFEYENYTPSKSELLEITNRYATPRQSIQNSVILAGRIHMLPECRLNEFCALFDVEKYQKETVPVGEIGCFGGGWGGIDTGTIWSHDMYQAGYTFGPMVLEHYAKHAAFEITGGGTKANSNAQSYWIAENLAKEYIDNTFGTLKFSLYVSWADLFDTFKRRSWLFLIHMHGSAKKVFHLG